MHSGFTLIEMLISILVLSIGLVLILQALQASAIALAKSRDVILASILLRDKLIEDPNNADKDRREGRFDMPYTAYQWSVDRSEVFIGGHAMFIVTASVWREGSRFCHGLSTLQLTH